MHDDTPRYRTMIYDSARWDGFTFRADDIVISTPPKSGTTWMQMLCALLIFQTPDLQAPLTELSPWLDVQTESVESVFAKLERQTHRRFIKSHTPFDALPKDDRVTYICVGRDTRDVALSWDNHFANLDLMAIIGARIAAVGGDDLADVMGDGPPVLPEDPVERFWAWVDDDDEDAGFANLRSTVHHLATFWDHRDDPNVALFHYNDLQADLDGEMRTLASTLGIDVDESRWPELVAAASFAEMRGRAAELAPQSTVEGFWVDTERFFNKGVSGQWQSFLGPDDVARFDARLAQLAAPDLAAWSQDGWMRSQRLP